MDVKLVFVESKWNILNFYRIHTFKTFSRRSLKASDRFATLLLPPCLLMEDLEAAGPSTKRPAEQSGTERQEEAEQSDPKPPSKKLKANHTFVHEEFTRYRYTVSGKEGQRVGSQCNACGYEMKDINPTNLILHFERRHPEILNKVEGEIQFVSASKLYCHFKLVTKLTEIPSRRSQRTKEPPWLTDYLFPQRRQRGRGKSR